MSQQDLTAKLMPARAPLPMPEQDFATPFHDPAAGRIEPIAGTRKWRIATFFPAVITTSLLIIIFADWFRKDGFVATEILMLAFVAFSTFWITLSVASATIGLFWPTREKGSSPGSDSAELNVSLLVPVYNEDPDAVFARLRAMRSALGAKATSHNYSFYVLSDTREDQLADRELQQASWLNSTGGAKIPFFYRRRKENIERKTGNIRQWIENWGGRSDAFIVLDADSLMGADAVIELTDRMARSPEAGLIQTVPRLVGANTMFSRVQQFANNVYGRILAEGLKRWCGNEANYWGHNAIIRTKAFAACAGLPKLPGDSPLSGTIKSHDFVEAALLRRAGWSVEIVPSVEETYEEIPQTLVDYVLRDRRWCQGNLQHLKLLGTKGFHAASRFHMVQGAMAYIASLIWFGLLILWSLMGRSESENVFRYFSETNPLFPQWPQMDTVSRLLILIVVFGLLLAPKVFALAAIVWRMRRLEAFGGPVRFFVSAVSEITLSFVLAPILMIQHVVAVVRAVTGFDAGWAPQNRQGGKYSVATLTRFHSLETITGILLTLGIGFQVVSLWIAPIAASLLMAIPISRLSGLQIGAGSSLESLMTTRENWQPSDILLLANQQRIDGSGKPKTGKRLEPRLVS